MKLKIKPLKQKTQFGCMATCYLMIKKYLFPESVEEDESELIKEAFSIDSGFNEHSYIKKFLNLNCKVLVYLETPFIQQEYESFNNTLDKKFKVEQRMIGLEDYIELANEGYLIITLVDLWHIDMVVNFAHFVILGGFDENSFTIIDSKYGKEIVFSKKRFQDTLDSIKYQIKYSPLIIAVKKSI